MAILVTGGAGYIGSHVVKYLIQQGKQVIVIDDLSTGYKQLVDRRAVYIQGKCGDQALVREVLKEYGIQGVIHMAAYSNIRESNRQEAIYWENNVEETKRLVLEAQQAGVAGVVFSSTAAVYRQPDSGKVQAEMKGNGLSYAPLGEDAPIGPQSVYGKTKYAVEQWLKQENIPHVNLRYFNACGSKWGLRELHNPEYHLIPRVLQVARGELQKLTIYGNTYDTPDGTCIRDYVHVADLAVAHGRALEYLQAGGKSISLNLGVGRGYSVKQVLQIVQELTGKEISYDIDDLVQEYVPYLVADSRLAKEVLGWEPEYRRLEDMIVSLFDKERQQV